MTQPITGSSKEANDLVNIFTTNVGDLEIGDPGNEGGSRFLSVQKEMIHHENEKERATLLGDLILVIGFTNVHPQVVRDILLKVIIGELEILFEPWIREPLAIPKVGSSNIFDGNLGKLSVEIQGGYNSLRDVVCIDHG